MEGIDMKCVVDYDKCTGLGICESLAPEYFEVNDAGELVQLRSGISEEDIQAVEEAAAGCPTEAITIER
jgi:ferredoxin